MSLKITRSDKTDLSRGIINLVDVINSLRAQGLLGVLNKGEYSQDINLVKEYDAKQIVKKYTRIDNKDRSLKVLDTGENNASIKCMLKEGDKYTNLKEENRWPGSLGDICNCPEIPDNFFDIVTSTGDLEHAYEPWNAVKEMARVLKPGGILLIIAPFSWKYHPRPIDFFRFTPQALEYLTGKYMKREILLSGFDIEYRRKNNFGGPAGSRDIPPIDILGGWLEHWQSTCIFKKI